MLSVLHLALSKLPGATPIVRHVMNPKALERHKLLGRMDNDTREVRMSRQADVHVQGQIALARMLHVTCCRMDADLSVGCWLLLQWTDGVLTAAARQVQREPRETHTWITSGELWALLSVAGWESPLPSALWLLTHTMLCVGLVCSLCQTVTSTPSGWSL